MAIGGRPEPQQMRPHQNMLMGDALFVTVLFGGLALAERLFPCLRERPALATS
jgi:hypothetical protein